jgi:hypothetical protein
VAGGPKVFKLVSKPVPRAETWGTLTALDIRNNGRMLWQVRTPQPLVGSTLATAGGLVFTGDSNGRFSAYDSKTGNVLWTHQTGANVLCREWTEVHCRRDWFGCGARRLRSAGRDQGLCLAAVTLPSSLKLVILTAPSGNRAVISSEPPSASI